MDVRRAERTSGRTKCDVPSRASGRCREIDRLFSECSRRVDQRGSDPCAWHLKAACLTKPERFVRHAGCGSATLRLRRKIPLLSGEQSPKTVCFGPFILTPLSQLTGPAAREDAPDGHRGQKVCTT